MRFAAILLPRAFDAPFDYAVPAGLHLAVGDYVRVPFGRAEEWGVVWGLSGSTTVPPEKIKPVLEKAPLPPMPEITRRFIQWVSAYTLNPLGSVLSLGISVRGAFEKIAPAATRAPVIATEKVTLSEEQLHAATLLKSAVAEQKYAAFLLDGVTGSGKTEVYLEAIRDVIAAGKQALVMVPEIVLTQPLIKRLEKRLGIKATGWHSTLTPKQRRERWQAIARGEAQLVVGARSALFLPFAKPGLIVVDEEHDHSFKQEDGVTYHGRDMAVAAAHLMQLPIVLVSATPSIETVQNCDAGKYQRLMLHSRHGEAVLPPVSLIDMRKEKLGAAHFISAALKNAVEEALQKGEQAVLFLNRRGYAPLTLCRACGHRLKCPNCSAWLVEHKSWNKLLCHHCGWQAKKPNHCPECKAEDSLHASGPGVERLEEEVRALFPAARVALLTSDNVATPKQAEALITKVENKEIDILIGTQMVAKGHHFPDLTLVGAIDADLGLEGGDLRAAEKSFQLLHQVSGRAGRAEKKGRVLLQTYNPEHPVMQALVHGGRDAFLAAETASRKRAGSPPFGRLAALVLSGRKELEVKQAALMVRKAAPQDAAFLVLGPAPAPLSQLKGRYRFRLLIKTSRTAPLQHYMRQWLSGVSLPSSVRLKVDIDPYSFL